MIYELLYLMPLLKSVTCVRVELPAVYDYQLSWDVINRTDFRFKVQAEMDALLSLDTDRPSNDDPELLIGGGGNTLTGLRDYPLSPLLLRSKDHNPLSGATETSFWITFMENIFRCGAGKLTTVDPFFDSSNFPTTNRIWISQYSTATGSWEIPDYLTMIIPPTLLPNTRVYWNVAGITSALLSIETCGSVDLIFTTASSGDYYQVGFGDCSNSNTPCTTITKFTSSSTSDTLAAAVNPLQCSSLVDIWISWESSAKRLQVGIGHVLNQNGLVSLGNLDDLNTIEKMEPRGTDTTQWKIDLYGCQFLNWQEWGSWSACNRRGQVRFRYRDCQCAHPPSDPNFDSLLYCDGNYRDELKSDAVTCRKWTYQGKRYSTTMDKSVITGVSKMVCMANCRQLTPRCMFFSHNKFEKLCWIYTTTFPPLFRFVSVNFVPNENFETYSYLT